MIRAPLSVTFTQFKGFGNGLSYITRNISTNKMPLQFKISEGLWGEPLKPKKKLDPGILKAREDRRRRRTEKMIKKRLRLDRQLKPIHENLTPACLEHELERRQREYTVPEKILDQRIKLFKEWSIAKNLETKSDVQLIDRLICSQQKALDELRLESEELYKEAIKIDLKLIPLQFTGPVVTPRLEDYKTPDGEYINTSKKWI